jgi:DNA-directed RNA polymerase specialized sigma24 family protein
MASASPAARGNSARIFLDLDNATIARQLGNNAGTVRMHLSRGVAALRHELNPTSIMEADQ